MERTYESAAALIGRAAGPLTSHLGPFVTSLIDQQYTASVICIKVRHALAFDRWLAKHRVVLADLGEAHVERYQRRSRRQHQRIRTETRRREWYEVTQLLQFLRSRGVCPAALVETTAADELAARYGQHLQDQQGLAAATIESYRTVAKRFLYERFGDGVADLRTLRTGDVIAFVQRQTQCLQPPALKCVVNAMRSFLRYAQYRGEVATSLAAAVPNVAAWTTTPAVPKAISPEHAQRAIDGCTPSTRAGLRDRAVLLLLARLGLRAHEIIALQLEDCDWDSGHLRVRSKSGREQLLPIPDMLPDFFLIATGKIAGRPEIHCAGDASDPASRPLLIVQVSRWGAWNRLWFGSPRFPYLFFDCFPRPLLLHNSTGRALLGGRQRQCGRPRALAYSGARRRLVERIWISTAAREFFRD